MGEFPFTDSYHRFEQTVKRTSRYVHGPEVRAFLDVVMGTSASRRDKIPRSSILFRAQRGYGWRLENAGTEEEWEAPDALDPERMVPKAELVGDGRANPRGIPCLYLATTYEVAVAEVRPWVGSYISLAQFKLVRDVSIVDCSGDKRMFPNWLLDEPQREIPPDKREQIAWGDIGYAFSRPVTPDDPLTEYVPTQILSEAFRAHGFDGIVYRSLLAQGLNVALFDCSAAELINCGLYEVETVQLKFNQCSNPYFITKHYEQLQRQEDRPDIAEQEPSSPV